MSRYNQWLDVSADGACKIRKRGSSSSSTSSTLLQNQRFKRAIVVSKKVGSSTPAPNWKRNAKSPSSGTVISEISQYKQLSVDGKTFQGHVSARKLASALWEMNRIPTSQVSGELRCYRGRSRHGMKTLPSHLSYPSHSPESNACAPSRSSSSRRQVQIISPKLLYSNNRKHRVVDLQSTPSFMETDTWSQGLNNTSSIKGNKNHLKDISRRLVTSKELLKVLSHVCGMKQKHSSCTSLFSNIYNELTRALVKVDGLLQEHCYRNSEESALKKQFLEEKLTSVCKEQEGIKIAPNFLIGELVSEKKLRRRAERLNKKLGLELANMRFALSKVNKALENERQSREIVEKVCDELVRGIGDDKAAVEELKKESAKVREELEKEREMLHLADIWREERVQMKLLEAKYHYEEKNAAVEQLRNELEAFLTANRAEGTILAADKMGFEYHVDVDEDMKENESIEKVADGRQRKEELQGEDDGECSTDSDLHSIELNMDSKTKSYKWNYPAGVSGYVSKLESGEGRRKDRRSSRCMMVTREGFPMDQSMMEENQWHFDHYLHQFNVGLDQSRVWDGNGLIESETGKPNEDAQRYLSVKGLRDSMLAGSRVTINRDQMSPTTDQISPATQSDEVQIVKNKAEHVDEGSKAEEIVKAFRNSGAKRRGVGNGNNACDAQMHITPVH